MSTTPIVDAAERLSAVLEDIADGLASAHPEALLATEDRLAHVLREFEVLRAQRDWGTPLPSDDGTDDPVRTRMRAATSRARIALTRCRHLGEMLARVTSASLTAQGRTGAAYDRTGVSRPVAPLRRRLEVQG